MSASLRTKARAPPLERSPALLKCVHRRGACLSSPPPRELKWVHLAIVSLTLRVLGYPTPMAIAVIVPEDEKYAALVRHAAENDLLIVDLQHLVLELRHDVANAEAATKIAQEATERLRAERRQGIADIRELLERFERR